MRKGARLPRACHKTTTYTGRKTEYRFFNTSRDWQTEVLQYQGSISALIERIKRHLNVSDYLEDAWNSTGVRAFLRSQEVFLSASNAWAFLIQIDSHGDIGRASNIEWVKAIYSHVIDIWNLPYLYLDENYGERSYAERAPVSPLSKIAQLKSGLVLLPTV